MSYYLNTIYFCVFTLLLQCCVGSAHEEKLSEGYYLSAIDVREDMVVWFQDSGYGIGIIEATVFAVGQDDKFIIVKQHPRIAPNKINREIVNYFIIPLKNKISKLPEKNILGPFSGAEFTQKKNELNIRNLDFTILFKDLE